MNFGTGPSFLALVPLLVTWGIPLLLLVWFIRTVTAIARRLGDIVLRLDALERAVRDVSRPIPPGER